MRFCSYYFFPYQTTPGHLTLAKSALNAVKLHLGQNGAREPLEVPLMFELSVANADKPTLSKSVVAARIEQFLRSETNAQSFPISFNGSSFLAVLFIN